MTVKTVAARDMKLVERIVAPPPRHWVGDGFHVSGFFPHGPLTGERMSPFFLLDYNAKMTFAPRERPYGVGPHPHRGFETVTIAYKGRVAHHDSRGGGGVIDEGDVQWMTAGSGLLHKEYYEKEFSSRGGTFHVVQLWVNLPAKDKMTPPKYQAITNAEMGRVALPLGGEAEIIAGEYNGQKGPATTFTPVHLINFRTKAGEKFELSYPASYTTAILAVEGSALINGGETLPLDHLALFERSGETVSIETPEDSVLLMMSGEPLNEPIAQYGPFLMNTREELEQAFDDYRSGKFGHLDD
ncbi:MAG: pirin family protein [Chloracidobacterium sp.]|nr:pirin family protein [Chloracidobacterium sp.]MCC6825240.1 pirin family protein [Acidobacteriota bacterium]MCO5332513.1 pirin family protein [Pyrinomonadaceae bacterium]